MMAAVTAPRIDAPGRRGRSGWLTLPVWLALMTGAGLAFHRWPTWSVLIGIGVTTAMAGLARWAGLSIADLGLSRATWRTGLRWGGAVVAMAAAGYAVALVVPPVRALVAGGSGAWSQTALAALLVIPLGTVVPEEFAFRGVLWAVVRRERGRWLATLVSSTLFGAWHVVPALGGGSANQAFDQVAGSGTMGLVLRVGSTVAFTAAAGVVLCVLRMRSGSLLAPMLAHAGINCLGVGFVQMA
ncbi:Abortive infection protein [Nakamurella multipartita DSM 44233]|uniref:Abortive infection protein n=2 Tax=Nakamurella TaxID=53460 RepID=C8XCA7_NAKMY|nr:Abortive infection protein [Nakamurella multipartita DSM 44233]